MSIGRILFCIALVLFLRVPVVSMPKSVYIPADTVTLSGKIVDSLSKQPVPYTKFTIKDTTGNTLADFIVGEKGNFVVSIPRTTEKIILIYQSTYAEFSKAVSYNSSKTSINLGTIEIPIQLSIDLKQIDVRAKRDNWYSYIQRRSYPVHSIESAEAPIMINFLRTLPGVMKIGKEIVVDGRKKPIYFLNGVACSSTMVENLPIESISRVDIVSNPPASRSIGADEVILNIQTKRISSLKIGGSTSLSGGTIRQIFGESSSVYITRNDFYFNISSNIYTNKYSGSKTNEWSDAGSEQFLTQISYPEYDLLPTFNNLTIQKKIFKSIEFSGSVRRNSMKVDYDSKSKQIISDTISNIFNAANTVIRKKNVDYIATAEVKAPVSQRMNVYLIGSYLKRNSRNEVSNIDWSIDNQTGTQSKTEVKNSGLQIHGDYKREKMNLEIGVSYGENLSHSLIYSLSKSQPSRNGVSTYHEKLRSIFGAFSYSFEKNISLNINGKFQDTKTFIALSDSASINRTKVFFYPQISLSKFSEKLGIFVASFRRDVTIPNSRNISTGSQLKNLNLVTRGGGFITQEFTNTFEVYHLVDLGEKKDYNISTNLYFKKINNLLDFSGYYRNNGESILQTTYQNIGRYSTIGANVQIKKKINNLSTGVNISIANYQYRLIDGIRSTNSFIGIDISASYTVNENLSADFSTKYRNRRVLPFEVVSIRSPVLSAGINKSLPKQGLNISLYWSNILNWGNKEFSIYRSAMITGTGNEQLRQQDIEVNLTWSFGKSIQARRSLSRNQVEQRNIKD